MASGDQRITDCMRRLVRGQQPEESGGSVFNITTEILKELVNIALASDQNKRELVNKEALKPITTALDERYGNDMNALAADLIGLLAEGGVDQARRCASFSHERISVLERLTQMSRMHNMPLRTSARAALYSMQVAPLQAPAGTPPNQLQNARHPQPGSQVTSLRSGNLLERGMPTTMTQRTTFEGDLTDIIFRNICHELGSEWQSLATQLGVSYNTISKLQADIPRDTSQQCFQMLREHWFNRQCSGMSDQQIKLKLNHALQLGLWEEMMCLINWNTLSRNQDSSWNTSREL